MLWPDLRTGFALRLPPPDSFHSFATALGAFGTRGIVNKKGADHHEPTTHYNPMISVYTVAWFKYVNHRQCHLPNHFLRHL